MEYHLDIAPHIARGLTFQPRDLLILKENLSLGRRMQLHERTHKRTLAAATLTDNTENLSTIHGKCHIVTRCKDLAALQRKALRYMLDAKNFLTLRLRHNAPLQSAVRHAGVPLCKASARVQ